MRSSIIALATILPLFASSLHQKKLKSDSNSNSNIITASLLYHPPWFVWRKGELARLVRELRLMDMSGGSFSIAVKLEKILMGSEYNAIGFDGYDELLAQRIVTFAAEAEMHGFKIGGAVRKCISEIFNSNGNERLIPHIMKSDNVEVKAAVMSIRGVYPQMWTEYYHIFKVDERVQRRLLELISFKYIVYTTSILLNWKSSFCRKVESIKDVNLKTSIPIQLSVYIKYSLQHRLLSPEKLMMEITETIDFNKLFSEMVENYEPNETSAEMDIEIVMAIYHGGYEVEIAEKIMSKSKFRGLPYEEFKQLKVAARFAKLNVFCLRYLFSRNYLGKYYNIDILKIENVEKLLRSGNAIQYFKTYTHTFKDNVSDDVKYEIGKNSARLLLEVSRHPTKYFWISRSISDIIELLNQVVSSIRLSFETNNEIVRNLDCAFNGGDLVDVLNPYMRDPFGIFRHLVFFTDSRGLYRREIAFFFALKRYIGEEDSFNNDELRFYSYPLILKNIDDVSKVECWKILFGNVAKPMNYCPYDT